MSMTGAETAVIEQWVDAVCAASPAITGQVGNRWYSSLAPQKIPYPFIVYQVQSSVDTYVVGPQRLLTDAEVLIRGVAATSSFDTLAPLASAIDTAFSGAASIAVGEATVSSVRRVRSFQQIEEYEFGQIRHLGGVWRVWVQA